MKRLFLSLLLVCLLFSVAPQRLLAIPALQGCQRQLVLTDGRIVRATLIGDEDGHCWRGDDGLLYTPVSSGNDIFQAVDSATWFSAWRARSADRQSIRQKRTATRVLSQSSPVAGQHRSVIILVNFADTVMQANNDTEAFRRMANEENYAEGSYVGSVHDYFRDQSGGQFDLTFDVVGPYTLSHPRSYYGENSELTGRDSRPGEMVVEACRLADGDVDYADYDWDGDGEVENVFVLYAGKGESEGGADDAVWPHEWRLTSSDYRNILNLDGVGINTYTCGQELNYWGQRVGIGIICHEVSHSLGLPDFYNPNSYDNWLHTWSLMAYGCYLERGYRPCSYTAHERYLCGWLEPIPLAADTTVTSISPASDFGEAYIYRNPVHGDEYILVSNIHRSGWDKKAAGEGLMVMHVDYNPKTWASNSPNADVSQPGCSLFMSHSRSNVKKAQSTDLWTDGTTFPTSSDVPLQFHHTDGADLSGITLSNITSHADGTMSFCFTSRSQVSVHSITNGEPARSAIFSLSGHRLPTQPKGVSIVNGRKTCVR